MKSFENDFTGAQRRGFKILKKVQIEVNDQIQTNLISKEDRKTHDCTLWFNLISERKGAKKWLKQSTVNRT